MRLEQAKRNINDARSVVDGAALLIDFVAAEVQTLIDRKARVEQFQEFVTDLRTNRQALATAVARNTPTESSGEAEPVPADQAPEGTEQESRVGVPIEGEAEAEPEEEKKEKRRATARKTAKAAAGVWAAKRTVSAVKKRRSK